MAIPARSLPLAIAIPLAGLPAHADAVAALTACRDLLAAEAATLDGAARDAAEADLRLFSTAIRGWELLDPEARVWLSDRATDLSLPTTAESCRETFGGDGARPPG